MLNKLKSKCDNLPPALAFEIFDKMILPILSYGSEVWGFREYKCIEQVQIKFCKRLLGVCSSTSNAAVVGECGRFPIFLTYYVKCIKYWLKLLKMHDSRFPRAVYNMLVTFDEVGRHTWASEIKHLLHRYGFGEVWYFQSVGCELTFLNQFQQRLKDCYLQDWRASVTSNSKLDTYSIIKSSFGLEAYLSLNLPWKFISFMAKLRCSSQSLTIEVGRHFSIDRCYRICPFCTVSRFIEDEYHFICVCDQYSNLRSVFVDEYYWREPNRTKFKKLMSTTNVVMLADLVKFAYHSSVLRDKIILCT